MKKIDLKFFKSLLANSKYFNDYELNRLGVFNYVSQINKEKVAILQDIEIYFDMVTLDEIKQTLPRIVSELKGLVQTCDQKWILAFENSIKNYHLYSSSLAISNLIELKEVLKEVTLKLINTSQYYNFIPQTVYNELIDSKIKNISIYDLNGFRLEFISYLYKLDENQVEPDTKNLSFEEYNAHRFEEKVIQINGIDINITEEDMSRFHESWLDVLDYCDVRQISLHDLIGIQNKIEKQERDENGYTDDDYENEKEYSIDELLHILSDECEFYDIIVSQIETIKKEANDDWIEKVDNFFIETNYGFEHVCEYFIINWTSELINKNEINKRKLLEGYIANIEEVISDAKYKEFNLKIKDYSAQSTSDYLLGYLNEELYLLKHVNTDQIPIELDLAKIKFNGSVEELACLLRFFEEEKIIEFEENKTNKSKSISAIFSTKKSESPSHKKILDKFNHPDEDAIKFWMVKFTNLKILEKKMIEKSRV